MARWNTIARGAALAAVASLALAACASSGDDDKSPASGAPATSPTGAEGALKIGTLLPVTGSLAFLGPPEVAGVELAIQEINDAGGVFDKPIELIQTDSSDADHQEVSKQSATELISAEVSAVVGAASSAVTKLVVDDITNAKIVMISPANTSTSLSGYSPFYFRTAPSDTAQGSAIAQVILADGYKNVGILALNDPYGTSLRDVVKSTIEEGGGTITYGNTGDEFDPAASNFSSNVQAILATNPEAIALISFVQAKQIIPELVAAGFPGSKIYMVDGNLADYSADFPAGTLTGAKGTTPGGETADDFKAKLDSAAGEPLKDYTYGAESYDATMLVALAALKGGAPDGVTIQANMAAVSGANGGTECSGWVACADLINAGEDIIYVSASGAGPFNAENDPSSAYIGIFEYGDDNTYTRVDTIFGTV